MPEDSLFITKLTPPRSRADHVPRPTLIARLNEAAERKLILLSAPPGAGKTTLAAAWCTQRPEPTAWLTLDAADNDPQRFIRYWIAALQPHIGVEISQTDPSTAIPALINGLAARSERLLIALDDYHVIENSEIHALVQAFVEHQPPQVTLILCTRSEPPLPLPRLRARGDLLEMRATDLRFDHSETAAFLKLALPQPLGEREIKALETRTEGWIAGLQLAVAALREPHVDAAQFIAAFTGSSRYVLDYLMEEVLLRLPEPRRQFLLHTAFLRMVNADLCEAVTGFADSQAALRALEADNLFITPVDQQRGWYRFHPLFADLLHDRLHAEAPDYERVLYQRAARWHAEHGDSQRAIDCALAAGDYTLAANWITGAAVEAARRGEVHTLLGWYQQFPREYLTQHPVLTSQFVLALALNGRWHEAGILLGDAPVMPDSDEHMLFRYWVSLGDQDAAGLNAITTRALNSPELSYAARIVLALLISARGDQRTACTLMADAQIGAERAGDPASALAALFHRCRLHVYLGDFKQAATLCDQALEQARVIGEAADTLATLAHNSLGRVYLEWNAPEAAAAHLREAIRLSEQSGFRAGVHSSATLMLAEALSAQGDLHGALETAEHAVLLAKRFDPPHEVDWLKVYQARIWLAQGLTAKVSAWLSDQPADLPPSAFYPVRILPLTRARALLVMHQPEAALRLLTALTDAPTDLLTVEVLAALAIARYAIGDSVNAMTALDQALRIGQPETRVRIFLDFGALMAKLLSKYLETHPDYTFARDLLHGLGERAESGLIEPLTAREREILRLISAGLTNDEIATALTVAVSTVKWYINALYSKLSVKTRAQAIVRARELGLTD